MKARKWLPLVAVAGLLWAGCDEQPTSPDNPSVRRSITPSFVLIGGTPGEPVSGAVYTSDENRDIVNENQYPAKEDVYLNGGPSDPDNPKDAALLHPPQPYSGDSQYWIYQVTDPSSKELLSEDPWYCRVVEVRNGRFWRVPSTSQVAEDFGLDPDEVGLFMLDKNKWTFQSVTDGGDCAHYAGGPFSSGEPEENVSVQLIPYQDTPNNGGVYKAWATPAVDFTAACQAYLPDFRDFVDKTIGNARYPNGQDCDTNHGFVNAQSKTDNYKVESQNAKYPAEITVWKFHDANMNCVWDVGEDEVTGWAVDVTDPFGGQSTDFTRFTYIAPEAGTYSFVEEVQAGTAQTASRLDEAPVSCYPTADAQVDVAVDDPAPNVGQQESRDVYYGNVGLGSITACKIYDADADGETDATESGIEDWKFILTGTQADGTLYGPDEDFTDQDGCVTWDGLFPGSYLVTEVLPASPDYYATFGEVSKSVTVTSSLDGAGETISGSDESVAFYNFCTTTVDFGTKGYWHNKNGLSRIEEDFVNNYVNTLNPYDDPTDYFGACDEPFDGLFSDLTTPCPGAMDASDGTDWAVGTWQAEISNYLVDNNSDTQCEQLAQQLLAFIFNVQYEMGGAGMIIVNGVPTDPFDMIDTAIEIWEGGDPNQCSDYQGILEAFNSSDAVEIQSGNICPFTY